MHLVLVAAAVLVDAESRILLGQRPPGKAYAGYWEFPGGKMQGSEAPEAALVRELHEELGIRVKAADLQPITFASHTYPDFHLLMPLYGCRRWLGTPRSEEGQALRWAESESLGSTAGIELLPADIALLPSIMMWVSSCR